MFHSKISRSTQDNTLRAIHHWEYKKTHLESSTNLHKTHQLCILNLKCSYNIYLHMPSFHLKYWIIFFRFQMFFWTQGASDILQMAWKVWKIFCILSYAFEEEHYISLHKRCSLPMLPKEKEIKTLKKEDQRVMARVHNCQ